MMRQAVLTGTASAAGQPARRGMGQDGTSNRSRETVGSRGGDGRDVTVVQVAYDDRLRMHRRREETGVPISGIREMAGAGR